MGKKNHFELDDEGLKNLKIGECLEAEIKFPDEGESMKMKVCKTKNGLKKS